MSKLVSALACCLLLNSLPTYANSEEELEKRCYIVVGKLTEIENFQHRAICKSKIASASFKIDIAATKMRYKRHKDVIHHLSYAMEDLNFAIRIDCLLKAEINRIEKETGAIKREVHEGKDRSGLN